jgi:hypothetical protein
MLAHLIQGGFAVSDVPCPHCGQPHPSEIAVCPSTGRAVPGTGPAPVASAGGGGGAAAAAAAAVPEKGVADLLREAYDMYRTHARALLLTCAVLFVPASIVKSAALAVIAGPTAQAADSLADSEPLRQLKQSTRELQEAFARNADPATIARIQEANARIVAELGRRGIVAASEASGGLMVWVLGALGTLVTAFFLYGVVVPLTNGALTITVADRVLGGAAGWREVWMLLFRRLGLLLSAVIPAAALIAIGCVLFVIPGLVLGLLFAFVSPAVLIEGLSGPAALRRSVDLVKSDWLRVTLVVVAFGVVSGLAHLLANLLIPSSAVFVASLFGDLFTMVLLPVPVLGAVLLYFDIRRKREQFNNDRLRADLETLRTA